MKQLFINKIKKEHTIQSIRKLEKKGLKNLIPDEKPLSSCPTPPPTPIVITDGDIFDEIKNKKIRGCECNDDKEHSCQLCFFYYLSLYPQFQYMKKRLDKLIEMKQGGFDIRKIQRGYDFVIEKLKQNF